MIIIGDKFIPYEKIEKINSIEEIETTTPNSTLVFKYDKNIMQYCMQNSISYMVEVCSIKESIYSNSMKAKYIICEEKIIDTVQKLAETYLFDSKILSYITSENEIEKLAIQGVDGVVFKSLIY